jgi:ParB family chromosome partitioning protein
MPKARRSLDVFTFRDRATGSHQVVPLASICLPEYQPRQYFDEAALEELVTTVKEHGVLEPLLVRPTQKANQYELVAGGRRYRAAQRADLTEVAVIVLSLTDSQALEVALIENLQRENLNPLEETIGILNLLAMKLSIPYEDVISLLYRLQKEVKGKVAHNVVGESEREMVKAVFNSLGLVSFESFVSHRLPLLSLPSEIQDALQSGKIAYTKAQALARVKDSELRKALLEEALTQELSLSQIKERIKASTPQPEPTSLEAKAKDTIHRFQKAKLWQNPAKKKKFERLLTQMEALLAEE